MSVDSSALEKSALEKKDRDELVTIAKALGGAPKARAKKADIVDLILELTGVGGGEDEAPDDVAAAPEEAAEAAGDDAGDDGPPEEPPAEWEIEAAAAAESADEPAPQARSPRQPQGGQGQNGQGGQNQRGGQNQESQGGQGDDDEAGNRRRRRRGRNRGQGGEGQGGQGQGGQGQGGQGQGQGGAPEEFTGEPVDVQGYLDLREEGYGFLRINGYLPSRDDIYVSVKQARQFGLRRGDHLTGASRPALRNEKNPALLRIDTVNGQEPDAARERPRFEDLTPLFPDEKLILEQSNDPGDMTARIVDLVAPIGKGQRGMIVSPPKAGKTSVMKQIARSIERNNPEVHLFVLLVDERPEEVTDMKRWLKNETSHVVASTFDRPAEEHIHVTELAVERAKRLVEQGADVVIILDGITRLARAYNVGAPTTGRVMSGGMDTGAIYPPKKIFGAARNVEEGGSLTILATALVETGSRMDEVIFEEFKGTGNMELKLDRRLAEQRIFPAIDVPASSTRHEELLFLGTQLQQVVKVRRVLSALVKEGSADSELELLVERMKSFKTNADFLAEIAKAK